MELTAKEIIADLELVRTKSPLVHNITNYVVMNSTANALLAVGASPVMAHAPEEVEDMVGIASALVVNIGTLSAPWVEAMMKAARRARERGIPVVYDPVGAGATPYRTRTFASLLQAAPPAIIRGNPSEIIAVAGAGSGTRGVDSSAAGESALACARSLNRELGCAVCVSGATDYIAGPSAVCAIRNGHPMMPRVTGLGCTATALCGAFSAVEADPFRATVSAMAVMGIAGEIAAEKSPGPGSLQLRFLDALYNLDGSEIRRRLRLECPAPA